MIIMISSVIKLLLYDHKCLCVDLQLVKKDILAQTVPVYVHLTVNLTLVNTRTDRVVVLQVGWVITVQQVGR